MTNSDSKNQRDIVAAVIIGRNEGDRLVQCLKSIAGAGVHIVYVDSGSTDGSVAEAQKVGAQIVELDLSRPFTAARARDTGYKALKDSGVEFDFVQFVDGDCRLVDGWIDAARNALMESPDLGIVTGWRSEINRDDSIYNALCDFEWRRPAGDILTCGGDMMVRREAFEDAGGFNDTVIAAEDDEFCVRVRKAGWKIRRIPVEMTKHDAAMTTFGQWWKRAVRSGHGFAQVGHLHPEYFKTERRRVWLFGAILPLIALIGAFISIWIPVGILGLYGVSYLRTVRGLQRQGLPINEALHHSIYLSLSKFPNVLGMLTFWLRHFQEGDMEIIEYK